MFLSIVLRRVLPVVFLGISLCVPALLAQRPVPPGVRQADQTETQAQKDIPPPTGQRANFDPTKLRRDADELATLAQSVQPEVDQVTRGILPKDLSEKLKRIEKLSKELRSQISH